MVYYFLNFIYYLNIIYWIFYSLKCFLSEFLKWLNLTFRLSMQNIKNCILSVFGNNLCWNWLWYAQIISYFKLHILVEIQRDSPSTLVHSTSWKYSTWWIFSINEPKLKRSILNRLKYKKIKLCYSSILINVSYVTFLRTILIKGTLTDI